jgi:hypothetical protein
MIMKRLYTAASALSDTVQQTDPFTKSPREAGNIYQIKDCMMESASLISRQYFPVGGKIDEGYVKQLYGESSIRWGEKEFTRVIAELKGERTNARTWGKQKVESMVMASMKVQRVNIHTMTGLKTEFKNDSSPEFAAKLWNGCYRSFDDAPNWEIQSETEYMQMNCLAYNDLKEGETETKGCIARLFVDVKKEVVKALNRSTVLTHGGQIWMKRTPEEVVSQGRYKKRKKGTTNSSFYSLAIGKDVSPSKVFAEILTNTVSLSLLFIFISNIDLLTHFPLF